IVAVASTWAGVSLAGPGPSRKPIPNVTAHAPHLVKPARAGANSKTVALTRDRKPKPATQLQVSAGTGGPAAPAPRTTGMRSAATLAATSPPFDECPAVGLDTS